MQKWEYLEMVVIYGEFAGNQIILSKGIPPITGDETKYLDFLGTEGWEIVNIANIDVKGIRNRSYHFKRPVK